MGFFGSKAVPVPSLYGNAHLHTFFNRKTAQKGGPIMFGENGSTAVCLGLDPRDPDYVLPWVLPEERGHSLCFSSTGGGKNTNLIIPALLTYGGSSFTLDVKGENAWATADRRRKLGQRVVILDPWNRVNEAYGSKVGITEQVSRFNPLSTLDPRALDFNDDVTLIADAVIVPNDRDPHWTDSARELVAGLIAASVEHAPGVASFRDVRALLTAPDDVLAVQVQKIVAANPDSLAGRKLSRFAKGTNEIASIRSTAVTQTAIFDAAALLDSMDTEAEAFDLADLVRKKVSVYVVLPAEKLITHGRWMRLVIQLALRAIAREPTPPAMPVLFMLDELGTINPGGGLRSIEQAYGLLGSQGVRIWGFFQSLDQLQRDYPATWQTFIANSETIQIIRVNDDNTAKYFSNHIGMSTWIRDPGGQWRPSLDGKINVRTKVHFDGRASMTHSREESQMTSRPAILPQELMKLGKGEVVTLFSGKDGWRLPTRPYWLEPRFAGWFRPNPLYPAAPPATTFKPVPTPTGLGNWFSGLPMRGKIGVGAVGAFALYVLAHLL